MSAAKKISNIIEDTLFTSLSEQIKKHNIFLNESKEAVKKGFGRTKELSGPELQVQKSILQEAQNSKIELLRLIDRYFNLKDDKDSIQESRISNFKSSIEQWCVQFPKRNVEYQVKERFYPGTGDPLRIRILKFGKRVVYGFFVLPQVISNQVRKIRKKPTKPYHYWRHVIPERALNRWFYKLKTIDSVLPICNEVDRYLLDQLKTIFSYSEYYDNQLINAAIKLIHTPDETPDQ